MVYVKRTTFGVGIPTLSNLPLSYTYYVCVSVYWVVFGKADIIFLRYLIFFIL